MSYIAQTLDRQQGHDAHVVAEQGRDGRSDDRTQRRSGKDRIESAAATATPAPSVAASPDVAAAGDTARVSPSLRVR
jgi:hypothetical protein